MRLATKFALITGTALLQLPGFIRKREQIIDTPYGDPSSPLVHGSVHGQPVVLLARHGLNHQLPPHKINYRANIWALQQAQVTDIIAISAVGAIKKSLAPGSFCLPKQIVDYTYNREHTFFDKFNEAPVHVDFSLPYSAKLAATVVDAAKQLAIPLHCESTLAVTQGPRLETIAEINKLERDGCDLVNMTAMPEAALAIESGLSMVNIALVVNMAAGRGQDNITQEDIVIVRDQAKPKLNSLVSAILKLASTCSITV